MCPNCEQAEKRAKAAESVANGLRSQEPVAFRDEMSLIWLVDPITIPVGTKLYAALATESVAAPQEAKPLAIGEEAATSEQPAAATEPQETDSEGWSKHPEHWANKSQANGLRSQEPGQNATELCEIECPDCRGSGYSISDSGFFWRQLCRKCFASGSVTVSRQKPAPAADRDEALRIEGWEQATEWLEGFSQMHYLVSRLREEIAKRRQASAVTGLAPWED